MKFLITGRPKSGKTTLLGGLLSNETDKHGLVANEVKVNGQRFGFNLEDSTGRTVPLSRTNKITNYPVGKYYVDLARLNRFIEPMSNFNEHQLLYVDEIGQMQLYSDHFKALVNTFIESQNDFIGTITNFYLDDYITALKARDDLLVVEIDPENRSRVAEFLTAALSHRNLVSIMPLTMQTEIMKMCRKYLQNREYLYLNKLFKNAVPYVSQSKVTPGNKIFVVDGKTRQHKLRIEESGLANCDCDLFNGDGKYAGLSGVCSHMQAFAINHAGRIRK